MGKTFLLYLIIAWEERRDGARGRGLGRLNLSPLLPRRCLETRQLLLGELGILGPRLPRARARRLNRLQVLEEVARVVGDAVELVAQVVDGFRIHFTQNVVHDGDGVALASDLGDESRHIGRSRTSTRACLAVLSMSALRAIRPDASSYSALCSAWVW